MKNVVKLFSIVAMVTLSFNIAFTQERTVLFSTDSIQLIQDFYPNMPRKNGGSSTTVIYFTENVWGNDTIGTPFGKIIDVRFDGKYVALIKKDFGFNAYSYYIETKINNKWVPYVTFTCSSGIDESCGMRITEDMFKIIGYRVNKNGIKEDFDCVFDVARKQYDIFVTSEQRVRTKWRTQDFLRPESYPKKNRQKKQL